MVIIREETPKDIDAVREINKRAFRQPAEAGIVDLLRMHCEGLLSLVAVKGEQIVGHILFSPVTILADGKTVQGLGLAPMAVLPEYQRQGIGSLLAETGINMLRTRGCPFIIVLGHPKYYPRFGFERASIYGIRSQWKVPDEAFMILILDRSVMKNVSGTAEYRSEFNIAME